LYAKARIPEPNVACSPLTAPTAIVNSVSAVASLTRLSPVRIVVTRRGSPSSSPCETVVMVSGGASTEPSTNAAARPIEGSSQDDSTPSAPAVSTTRRTPRLTMALRFWPNALNDAPRVAE
jgi:hypothetical protein